MIVYFLSKVTGLGRNVLNQQYAGLFKNVCC